MSPSAIDPPAVESLKAPKATMPTADASSLGTKRKIICFSGTNHESANA